MASYSGFGGGYSRGGGGFGGGYSGGGGGGRGSRYGIGSYGCGSYGTESYGEDNYGAGDGYDGENYGDDSYGGENYGGESYGGESYGGESYGGESYGGDSYGGDSYGGKSYGGRSFGGGSFSGVRYGGESYGGGNSGNSGDGYHGRSQGGYRSEYYENKKGYGYESSSRKVMNSMDDNDSRRTRLANLSICVDYIRGSCSKGNRCPKPHVDYVESIDEREILSKVKFCHDFQNKGECQRTGCRFLHVTRGEEDEFLLTGSIPASVFSRMQESLGESDPNYTPFLQGDGGKGFRGGGGRGRGVLFGGRGGGSFGGRGGGSFGGRGWGGGRGHAEGGGYRGRGRGGFGHKRPYDGGDEDRGFSKFHSGGGRGRGGRGGGQKHSSSQPITYGDICVDYLKGTCVKGGECHLIHYETIDDPEERTGLVGAVFCHDFQNGTCLRNFCKFVHASRQEEGFFVENGYFAPSLNARNRDKLFYSDICLDNLRSQCIRGSKCYYKHVTQVETASERLCLSRSIFCHDFQEGNCTRYPCKMVHTAKADEDYFLETGYFPKGLKSKSANANKADSANIPNLNRLSQNVCREFVKKQCHRGSSCRYYHPCTEELEFLLAQQGSNVGGGKGGGVAGRGEGNDGSGGGKVGSGGGGEGSGGRGEESGAGESEEQLTIIDEEETPQLTENVDLRSRVNQLERLLADACYCMTLAVGDQNPAISSLMRTITDMAPESALANQQGSSHEDDKAGE